MNYIAHFTSHYRQGTILIITAGISALLASLALTFLLRMRSDVMESTFTVRDAQARIMLVAACHYIQEAARIGYDDSKTEYHKEAYGWIDVRDGAIGPKPSNASFDSSGQKPYGEMGYSGDDDRHFPTQSVRVFPMHAIQRPPYAISMNVAPNPIDPDPPSNGTPWLVNEDPTPPAEIVAKPINQQFSEWKKGDFNPRPQSQGRSWFRLLRCGPGPKAHLARYNAATFIVTCGAGASNGYRSSDWPTMTTEERALFGNDKSYLAALEADEVRYWYLVEWSPAVGDNMMNSLDNLSMPSPISKNPTKTSAGSWSYPQYTSNQPNYTLNGFEQPLKQRNFAGTISYVQRLVYEPPDW